MKARETLLGVAIACATVIAYWPALGAGFVWDDDAHITENRCLDSAGGLARLWTDAKAIPARQNYPLTFTSFWLEKRLWGDDPAGYHLVNVLLHAASALVLWRLLRRLAVPGAWLGAALFALHPVAVESVAWVSERKNTLSMLLYLCSFHAYLRFEERHERGAGGAWRAWLGALALYMLSLCAKTTACGLPVAIAIAVWWRRGALRPIDLSLAIFLAVGAALSLPTADIEREHVGAEGPAWDLDAGERVLVAGRAWCFYLGKLLYPADLSFFYERWKLDAAVPSAWLYPAGAAALLLSLWLARGRIGRGPFAALLCFTISVAPALGFFDVYPFRFSYVADHFQYLAIAPVLALGAALFAAGSERARLPRPASAAAALLTLGVLGSLSMDRARAFESGKTLWEDTIRKNPAAWIAHNNLGMVHQRAGEIDEAIACFERALAIDPKLPEPLANLAGAYQLTGRDAEFEAIFQRLLAVEPNNPRAQAKLGARAIDEGRLDAAEKHLRAALAGDPKLASAHAGLGLVQLRRGRLEEAERLLKLAIDFDADVRMARAHLGMLYGMTKRYDEAIQMLKRSIELHPREDFAYQNLGQAYLESGKPEEAIVVYESMLARDVNPGLAHVLLARLYLKLGDSAKAARHYEDAVALGVTVPADLEAQFGARQR